MDYQSLSSEVLEKTLRVSGVATLELTGSHAEACADLMRLYGKMLNYDARDVGIVGRLLDVVSGLWLILRILIFHGRLYELLQVVVLAKPHTSWKQEGGLYVFELRRADKNAI
jgi:hypothetical protein